MRKGRGPEVQRETFVYPRDCQAGILASLTGASYGFPHNETTIQSERGQTAQGDCEASR